MGRFSASLSQAVLDTQSDIDITIRTVLFSFGERLVNRSPVGNPDLWESKAPPGYVGGHFRAQWQHGFNSPPIDEITEVDPGGETTINNIRTSIFESQVSGIHWIVNMAPYAQELEDGHSTQAPTGIVRLSILDFDGLLEISVPT